MRRPSGKTRSTRWSPRRREKRAPARMVDDADRVAADRGREHLPGRVADEVELREPPERLADPLRGEEDLPAPRHPPGGHEEDRERREEPRRVARDDQVDGPLEVDQPDEVCDQAAAD